MKKITLFKPFVSWRARFYTLKTLMGTQLAEGPMVKQFETEFATKFKLDRQNVVALNSGTTALELAYELAGIKEGDEVITPVLTCTATNLPLVRRGAKIIFADINAKLLMDPEDVKKRITKKTKAIVYVDFGGASSSLREIAELAHEKGITLIQDAAQSVGPLFNPKGDFICVSLQSIKLLTAGDGGILITKDWMAAKTARMLRWFGYDRDLKQKMGDTDLELVGYKYHMNDISASIALGNLRSLDKPIATRAKIAKIYLRSGLPILVYPWLAILIMPKADKIKEELACLGIDSGPYHYRNDKYTVFGGLRKDLPMMDKFENAYLLLPYHHGMTEDDARRVIGAVALHATIEIVTMGMKQFASWPDQKHL